MARKGIRVAEEVGERHGGEGVVMVEGVLVEFDHYVRTLDMLLRPCEVWARRGTALWASGVGRRSSGDR